MEAKLADPTSQFQTLSRPQSQIILPKVAEVPKVLRDSVRTPQDVNLP